MRIRVFFLILLLVLLYGIHTTVDAESNSENDSVTVKQSTQKADTGENTGIDTTAYVKQNELLDVKELLEGNAKRAVLSRYSVNLSGYGMLGAGLAFKDSIVGSFTSPLSGSGVLAGLNLSGKLRDDPARDGDLSLFYCH